MSASGLSPLALPEQYLQVLLDAAPDAMIVATRSGRIKLVNARTEELFGYTRNELLGQKVEMLMPRRFRGRHRLLRSEYFSNPAIRPMFGGRELWGLRKDASEFPADISVSPVRGDKGPLAILAIRNISERRRMELALRTSEEHFRMALMHTPVVVFNQNRRLRYTWIYSSIPAWLGQEYVGHSDAEIFERKEAVRQTAIKRRVLQSGAGAHCETAIKFLGKKHYLDLTVEPIYDRRNNVAGLTGAYVDVTPLKCYALEREKLVADLQTALEQVKVLKGLASICAWCKRIFNEEGAWQQLESYIQAHSELKFSHGLCPDCMQKMRDDAHPG